MKAGGGSKGLLLVAVGRFVPGGVKGSGYATGTSFLGGCGDPYSGDTKSIFFQRNLLKG
jgi:hypothetical protein